MVAACMGLSRWAVESLVVDERADALGELPVAYAVALRLSDAGVSTQVIAQAVGVEVEAVGPLLRLARAKLAEVLNASGRVPRPR